MNCPCMNCAERHEACHSECEKYAAYREKIDAIKAARDKERGVFGVMADRAAKNAKYKQHIAGRSAVFRGK